MQKLNEGTYERGPAIHRFAKIGAVIGVPLTALGLLFYAYESKEDWIPYFYSVTPPVPSYSSPRSAAEAQKDDLDYLRNITTLDWSYTEASRAHANKIIDASERALPLSRSAFQLAVAQVLAAADNGHTNVWGGTTANRFNRLPVRFYVFADGIFVVRALPEEVSLLGDRLEAIDGVSTSAIRMALKKFTGGTENEKNSRLPFYLESPELLNAAGIAKRSDRISLSLVDALGIRRTVSLIALPPDPHAPKLWPSTALKPVLNPGEQPSWIPALRSAKNLLMFTGAPSPFFLGKVPGRDAYYVRFDTNNDEAGVSITDFAERALQTLSAVRPPIVLVDLRMNGGGDYTTTARFMRQLPRALPDTRIDVLISQETFSAGMTSAAFLKQAGNDRVVFVGDWPGDRMRFHSEGNDFCLPFSHICMTARTAIHDYSTVDCRPYLECYFLDRFYPVAITSFAPQIYAPLRFSDLSKGHDPALDAIFKQ